MEDDSIKLNKSTLWKIATGILVVLLILFLWNPWGGDSGATGETTEPTQLEGSTFLQLTDNVCADSEGKPYVILFSTTWCPHCTWIKDTFDSLADEGFADQINLMHWELDTGDNTLTPEIETEVPAEFMSMYRTYNPRGSIPTFVFGCKYIRIGNGYESSDGLDAELEDFKLVINELLG